MARFTPPSDREHPPTGPSGCIGGVHSPGPPTNTDISAASNGSQSVTRDQPSGKAPPKK